MRHTGRILVLAGSFSLAIAVLAGGRLLAAGGPSAPGPKDPVKHAPGSIGTMVLDGLMNPPPKPAPAATLQKLKELGAHLGRAFDIVVDLFSNNQADLLSNNKAALLSGNKPTVLSGNRTKVLSDNTTPILSGNKFSFLSDIKIEVRIVNSGNTAGEKGPVPPGPAHPKAKP